MTGYKEIEHFLLHELPMFQSVGAAAYKPGLDRAITIANAFGNPHRQLRCIHVAGTNGKGSVSHTLAAILASAGYSVGLYTSPHLADMRERIRVDGKMMPRRAVVDFVKRYQALNLQCQPSFFELTTIMAFDWFAKCQCDFVVVEVGLGGLLDTTNIISPLLSIITNISYDHMAILGDTLAEIARQKGGIIKRGVPVVIGNANDSSVRNVLTGIAAEKSAPCIIASDTQCFSSATLTDKGIVYKDTIAGTITGELTGQCQIENTATILCAIADLRRQGIEITDKAVRRGFAHVCSLTGFFGRWTIISHSPLTICDAGHNVGGWHYIAPQLKSYGSRLRIVIGFVSDKDVSSILAMLPADATYFFTQPPSPRALPAQELADQAKAYGLNGSCYQIVADAFRAAQTDADGVEDAVIFVGGSCYVVAELYKLLKGC